MSKKQRYSVFEAIDAGLFFSIYGLVKYLPSPIFDVVRFAVLWFFMKKLSSMRIKDGVTVWFPRGISIGKNVSINEWVFLDGYGELSIGDNTRIAHGCSIVSEDHGYESVEIPIYKQKKVKRKVVIEEDVWLGAGVKVLKGVRIGKGSIVGAGAVVTRDLPSFSIAVGVPAEVIKRRVD